MFNINDYQIDRHDSSNVLLENDLREHQRSLMLVRSKSEISAEIDTVYFSLLLNLIECLKVFHTTFYFLFCI